MGIARTNETKRVGIGNAALLETEAALQRLPRVRPIDRTERVRRNAIGHDFKARKFVPG